MGQSNAPGPSKTIEKVLACRVAKVMQHPPLLWMSVEGSKNTGSMDPDCVRQRCQLTVANAEEEPKFERNIHGVGSCVKRSCVASFARHDDSRQNRCDKIIRDTFVRDMILRGRVMQDLV